MRNKIETQDRIILLLGSVEGIGLERRVIERSLIDL